MDAWGPPPLERMTKLFFQMNAADINTRISNERRVAIDPLVHVHQIRAEGVVMSDENVKVTAALVDHPPVVPAFGFDSIQGIVGVRVAIGGSTRDILRDVIGEGMRLTLVGIALGLAGAVATTRALSRLLFGVEPTDPNIFAGVALLLVVIGFLASYVPARRAMRVDPLTALRME